MIILVATEQVVSYSPHQSDQIPLKVLKYSEITQYNQEIKMSINFNLNIYLEIP